MGQRVKARMGKPFALRRHTGHDDRIAMAGIQYPDPADEIDITIAIDIPGFGIQRPIQINRVQSTNTI